MELTAAAAAEAALPVKSGLTGLLAPIQPTPILSIEEQALMVAAEIKILPAEAAEAVMVVRVETALNPSLQTQAEAVVEAAAMAVMVEPPVVPIPMRVVEAAAMEPTVETALCAEAEAAEVTAAAQKAVLAM